MIFHLSGGTTPFRSTGGVGPAQDSQCICLNKGLSGYMEQTPLNLAGLDGLCWRETQATPRMPKAEAGQLGRMNRRIGLSKTRLVRVTWGDTHTCTHAGAHAFGHLSTDPSGSLDLPFKYPPLLLTPGLLVKIL